MKLLLKRDQRPAAIMGAPTFTLDVRAEITPEERAAIDKYKLGKTLLYVRNPNVPEVVVGPFPPENIAAAAGQDSPRVVGASRIPEDRNCAGMLPFYVLVDRRQL